MHIEYLVIWFFLQESLTIYIYIYIIYLKYYLWELFCKWVEPSPKLRLEILRVNERYSTEQTKGIPPTSILFLLYTPLYFFFPFKNKNLKLQFCLHLLHQPHQSKTSNQCCGAQKYSWAIVNGRRWSPLALYD